MGEPHTPASSHAWPHPPANHAPSATHTPQPCTPPQSHTPTMHAPCHAHPSTTHPRPAMHASPVNRMIDTCENTTFLQLRLRAVKMGSVATSGSVHMLHLHLCPWKIDANAKFTCEPNFYFKFSSQKIPNSKLDNIYSMFKTNLSLQTETCSFKSLHCSDSRNRYVHLPGWILLQFLMLQYRLQQFYSMLPVVSKPTFIPIDIRMWRIKNPTRHLW